MPTYFHFWYQNPHHPEDDHIFNGQLESRRCDFTKPNGQRCKRQCIIGLPCCHSHLPVKYHIQVTTSLIPHAGKGLFVIDRMKDANAVIFRKGATICPYDGELIDRATLEHRYGPDELGLTAPYAVAVNHRRYEDAALQRGVGALLNHKPEHQCNCRLGNPNRSNHTPIKAIKDIRNGEELYCDYGDAYQMNVPYVHYDTNHRKYY